MQQLLEHGATAVMNSGIRIQHLSTWYDTTALMMCETVETVKVLLAAGADVHVTTAAGDTCLHSAAGRKRPVPVICLLIKAGVDLHAVNSNGKTAAHVAHDKGYTLIEQLLNRAAEQQAH
jgi:ankyrin repeat protein